MTIKFFKMITSLSAFIVVSTIFSMPARAENNGSLYDVMEDEALQSCKKSPPIKLPEGVTPQVFCECYSSKLANLNSMKMLGVLNNKDLKAGKADAIKECSSPTTNDQKQKTS